MESKRTIETSDAQPAREEQPSTPRAKYEPPRLLRKHSIRRVTLLSGNQCVFDPPGTC